MQNERVKSGKTLTVSLFWKTSLLKLIEKWYFIL